MKNNFTTDGSSEMSPAMLLLRKTEKKDLFWIPLSKIIQYLNEENIPLSNIQEIYTYIVFQQRSRYIPDIEKHTYICSYENKLAILSQGSYSSRMRLTVMNLNNRVKSWKVVDDSQITLVRLRNTIEMSEISDSRSDIEDFLYSMREIHV